LFDASTTSLLTFPLFLDLAPSRSGASSPFPRRHSVPLTPPSAQLHHPQLPHGVRHWEVGQQDQGNSRSFGCSVASERGHASRQYRSSSRAPPFPSFAFTHAHAVSCSVFCLFRESPTRSTSPSTTSARSCRSIPSRLLPTLRTVRQAAVGLTSTLRVEETTEEDAAAEEEDGQAGMVEDRVVVAGERRCRVLDLAHRLSRSLFPTSWSVSRERASLDSEGPS
jgi:hypothetical protein